jgi:hypothetical protein
LLLSVGLRHGDHGLAEPLRVLVVGEHVDVIAEPVNEVVSLEGVTARECEPVIAEDAKADPDQAVLEVVHELRRVGELGEALFPRPPYPPRQPEARPHADEHFPVDVSPHFLSCGDLLEDELVDGSTIVLLSKPQSSELILSASPLVSITAIDPGSRRRRSTRSRSRSLMSAMAKGRPAAERASQAESAGLRGRGATPPAAASGRSADVAAQTSGDADRGHRGFFELEAMAEMQEAAKPLLAA